MVALSQGSYYIHKIVSTDKKIVIKPEAHVVIFDINDESQILDLCL